MNLDMYEYYQLFLQEHFPHENQIELPKYSQVPNIFEESIFRLHDNEPSK